MIAYLIKLTLCSGLLLAAYHLLLEKEKMHKFNRFYLLAAIIFSFIIPLVSIRVGTITIVDEPAPVVFHTEPLPASNEAPVINTAPETTVVQSTEDYLPLALQVVYCLVTLILLSRFAGTIIRLWGKASRALGLRYKNAKLVLLKEQTATHTFLNTIFVSHNDYKDHHVDAAVLTHELTHVKQRHSLDVLFIELVKSIAWFNPIFILYKRAIQLNHEFLADDAVIDTYNDVSAYQYLLLEKISQSNSHSLSSRLNFLITKKRLVMMTQEKNKKRAAMKTIIVAALLTSAFFMFVERTYAQVKTNPPVKKNEQPATTIQAKSDSSKGARIFIKDDKDSTSVFTGIYYPIGTVHGDGVTQEQFDEYEKAIKSAYIRKTAPNGVKYYQVDVSGLDIRHLYSIYKNMTKEQQRKAPRLLGYIPVDPPPTKRVPTAEQLKQWQNPSYAGVWIDNKRVSNTVLSNYKPSDFSLAYQSLLYPNAANYGKHKFQVDLYTNADFEKQYKGWEKHYEKVTGELPPRR